MITDLGIYVLGAKNKAMRALQRSKIEEVKEGHYHVDEETRTYRFNVREFNQEIQITWLDHHKRLRVAKFIARYSIKVNA